jgi:hypothetical protein
MNWTNGIKESLSIFLIISFRSLLRWAQFASIVAVQYQVFFSSVLDK